MNLDYKFCEKLKDFNFPQVTKEYWCSDVDDSPEIWVTRTSLEMLQRLGYDKVAKPNLDELINCLCLEGEDTFILTKDRDGFEPSFWEVCLEGKITENVIGNGIGDSPIEAVANLWLELNSKKFKPKYSKKNNKELNEILSKHPDVLMVSSVYDEISLLLEDKDRQLRC